MKHRVPQGRSCGRTELAHREAIATDASAGSRGVAQGLLLGARRRCGSRAPALWLRVEADNAGAIRHYEQVGMRKAGGTPNEHWMVWPWAEAAENVSSADG